MHAMVKANGKYYVATKGVKKTLGGCGVIDNRLQRRDAALSARWCAWAHGALRRLVLTALHARLSGTKVQRRKNMPDPMRIRAQLKDGGITEVRVLMAHIAEPAAQRWRG